MIRFTLSNDSSCNAQFHSCFQCSNYELKVFAWALGWVTSCIDLAKDVEHNHVSRNFRKLHQKQSSLHLQLFHSFIITFYEKKPCLITPVLGSLSSRTHCIHKLCSTNAYPHIHTHTHTHTSIHAHSSLLQPQTCAHTHPCTHPSSSLRTKDLCYIHRSPVEHT